MVIIMLFENIHVLQEDGTVLDNAYLLTQGERIAYIGQDRPDAQLSDGEETYNGADKLVIPSFINTHCHVPMTLLRGYGEGLPLHEWLFDRVFPIEDKLTGEQVYYASLLGIAEMLASGVTSFTDMYFFCGDIARAVLESGIKCNLCKGVTGIDGTAPQENKHVLQGVQLCEEYNGAANGRIMTDLCIHAEYTSDPALVAYVADYAKKIDTRMHIHLSETKREHEECKERWGKTPAQYFDGLGVFDVKTTAAHCVFLEGEDFDLLAQKGVTVAHCPSSNLKLGSGVADIARMQTAGINITIGTDGASSNNNLNMLEELHVASLLQKGVSNDPLAMPPQSVLDMATKNAALSQDRPDTGALKEGNRADLAVIDLHRPHLLPRHDLLSNLVYSAQASDVVLTMCDGKVLYRDGEYTTIDIERVYAGVEKSVGELF